MRPTPSPSRPPKVGLVLGAGGTVGIAWHVGVLDALQRATGWDPAGADVLVGTSAGSVVAAVLAQRQSPFTLLELADDWPLLEQRMAEATAGVPRQRSLPLWPGSLPLGLAGLLARDSHQRLTSLLHFLPRGLRTPDDVRGLSHAAVKDGWPARRGLWIVATDDRNGRRVVFGRDGEVEAPFNDAVAASCAVPAYYSPVRIGERRYVDGGLWSFTNADLLADAGCDVAVVLSPSGARERGPVLDTVVAGVLRRNVRERLTREVRLLESRGIRVVRIEPSARDIAAMGLNPMGIGRRKRIIDTAIEETAALLEADPSIAEALKPSRPPRRAARAARSPARAA